MTIHDTSSSLKTPTHFVLYDREAPTFARRCQEDHHVAWASPHCASCSSWAWHGQAIGEFLEMLQISADTVPKTPKNHEKPLVYLRFPSFPDTDNGFGVLGPAQVSKRNNNMLSRLGMEVDPQRLDMV